MTILSHSIWKVKKSQQLAEGTKQGKVLYPCSLCPSLPRSTGRRDEVKQNDRAGVLFGVSTDKIMVLRQYNFMDRILNPHSASDELCNLQLVP